MNTTADNSRMRNTAGKKGFRGYDLDELRYRLMLNDIKIQFVRSRLVSELVPARGSQATGMAGLRHSFENWLMYGRIALFSYRTAKKLLAIFHGFKKKR